MLHTEQLRRVSCYVKAWCDKWWEKGGPTSVSLMIGIAQNFDAKTGRDDLALEHAFRSLAQALKGDIREPAIDAGEEDFNRLTEDERAVAGQRALEAAETIQHARMGDVHDESAAIAVLRNVLGDRVPFDTSLVDPDTVAVEVLSTPSRTVPAPVVLSTTAG